MGTAADEVILVGVFPEFIELAEECGKRIVGLVHPTLTGVQHGYPILGGDVDAARICQRYPGVPVCIGLDAPTRRSHLVELYTQAGFSFASLVHPQAKISRSAEYGTGALIGFGAHISTNVRLADHVRVNVYANVFHDVQVGEFSTIAPNAIVLGRVRIGAHCYIGAGAVVLPNIEIGDASQIGSQANVTKSVAPGNVMVGNPARPIE